METISTYNKKSTTSKMQNQAESLLSEAQLYVSDLHFNVTEDDLKNIFIELENISVEIRRQNSPTTAILRFTTIENAEKAFACYNNMKAESLNKSYLKLLIHDPISNTPRNEPQSNAYILQVKSLPLNTNNLILYNLFRPYGPLFSCRIQIPNNKPFNGFALVQFFRQEHAEVAMSNTHCLNVDGKTITVSQYHAKNNNTPKIRTNNIGNNSNFNFAIAGHTFSPQGSNNNHNNNNNQTTPMSPGPEGPIVDPCNLFIKNLDANISSSDLFNQFRRYGRIISARVMRDQETGNSKGFGFVSYTSAEEADKAKSSMHGKTLGTKQIVVRLHEPKKLREAKLANHFSGSPTSPSESRTPSRRNSDFFNINTVNEFGQEDLNGLAPKARKEVLMSELQKRFKYIPTIPADEVNSIVEQLLTSKVPEVLQMLKDASLLQQRITEARSIILHDKKRRGNEVANVPTTSLINNNNIQVVSQREKFLKAIDKICPQNSNEILDLLMTLSPKDRSLCLFNEQYLNKKIIEANTALELANTDHELSNLKISADLAPASNPGTLEPSIVLSHSKTNYATDVPTVVSGIHSPEYKEIEEFMETLKNKPMNEQKQKLGDRLFPRVKSLGLKSAIASKVTINLLDTDDLYELAHSMNDQEKFKQKVSAAAAKVVPNK
ncbi:hypothetical protein C1645_493582 [Glomus cerebriforme]|uniref:Uncharacterized protein n=1 Tax=Glomus cerebriforme TaxID=658196 RepID=A0A397TD55_9GLOM|nr:hypothetical protein C1645_493582 [Glomus cerebriforme]